MLARRRIPSVLLVTATLLMAGAPRRVSGQISVQDALSISFASGLVAAPAGDRVAWVEDEEGARNVWLAEGPTWQGRRLTAFTEDDGQEIAALAITPDGSGVLYVRGGAPNRAGEVPDPLSTPDVEGRAVWIVPTEGGEPRKLADAGGFALSPDGGRIAYARGREIWTVDLGPDAEAARLATVRGGPGSLVWAPDGGRLAFVSNRGDHAFVGVVAPGSERVLYLDPGVGLDTSPVWSPDGRQVAFLRLPHERDLLPFEPHREGLPFSIRIADASSGQGREVWKAPEGRGSVFSGVNAVRQLFWGRGDNLVFPWEGDGWKHLYSIPVAGGTPQVLTPGDFEVQYVSMTPDGSAMVYDSNQGDIDRKHVWRVPVSGGRAEPLTPGTGLEWGGVVTAEGTLAYHASGTDTPAHTVVRVGSQDRSVSPAVPRAFPGNRFVTPRQVVFRAADGMEIHGQLFLPPDHRAGQRHPAMIFFHGGSRRQMLLGFHHLGYYHNAYAFNQVLASHGYVVLAVNYRSGIGYGMAFREALDYGAAGASEFNDVLGAGLYLQGRDDVDARRIGLWGGSYGGYLTAMGLSRASDLFAAGVDLHGVHDWNVVIKNFVPDYDPQARPDFSRRAFESSPMASLDGWRSPVLLIHGDDDRNVPFSESVDMAESLSRRHVDFEELIFPDEVHGFLMHRSWVAAYEAALDFLRRKLGPEAAPSRGSGGASPDLGFLFPSSPAVSTDSLRALYDRGRTFSTFLEQARRRRDQWVDHYDAGRVPPDLLARARAVGGTWRILAVAEDWCGDSVNTVPYVARLVEQVDGLDMRVVSSTEGRAVMNSHRTPDGRPATPTLVLLDADWNDAGCMVERPSPLMAWYMQNRGGMDSDELHAHIFDWYDRDAGRATVADVVSLMESAAAGASHCAEVSGS